jgi:hypothetical protein
MTDGGSRTVCAGLPGALGGPVDGSRRVARGSPEREDGMQRPLSPGTPRGVGGERKRSGRPGDRWFGGCSVSCGPVATWPRVVRRRGVGGPAAHTTDDVHAEQDGTSPAAAVRPARPPTCPSFAVPCRMYGSCRAMFALGTPRGTTRIIFYLSCLLQQSRCLAKQESQRTTSFR